MRIRKLVWFEEIIEKLVHKHRVSQSEVREILAKHPLVRFVERGHRPGENVYAALGRTSAGRYLIVFFVRKRDGQAIILSARDMTKSERKRYEREKTS